MRTLWLIVFAILFFIVRKFVVPSFEKTFAERTTAIEGGLKAAETKQAEADAASLAAYVAMGLAAALAVCAIGANTPLPVKLRS